MKICRVILALLLCVMLGIPAACADGVNSKWTLGNVCVEVMEEKFQLGSQARLSIADGEDALALHFEIGLGEKVHLPMSAELSLDTIGFSIGRGERVYTMETDVLMEKLNIGEDGKMLLQQIPMLVETYMSLENKALDIQYLKQYDASLVRMYEILFGGTAEDTEVNVDDRVMPAKQYKGEMQIGHIVELMEYLRECDVPEFKEFAVQLLDAMNLAVGEQYADFSSHFQDIKEAGLLQDENFSFGTVELIDGHDDDVIYQKYTVSEGENSIMVYEHIIYPDRSVFTETVTNKDEKEENVYLEELRAEITGPIHAIEQIHLDMKTANRSQWVDAYANRNRIVEDVLFITMDAETSDGLWNGSMDITQDIRNSYDYGDGPQMLTDKTIASCGYTEKREEDGSITGSIAMDMDFDDRYTVAFSCDLNRSGDAQVEALIDENSSVYALTAESTDLGYKLLQADAFNLMAEAVELYADEGLSGLVNYFNSSEDMDWPEELGEELQAQYEKYYNDPWRTVYSYSDAMNIFTGSIPQYNPPEGSVLEFINVGANNMVIHYLNDAGDFQIDITHLGNLAPQDKLYAPEDFVYCEEDGKIEMAYHYDEGNTLVFFAFEDADQEQAMNIISGFQMKARENDLVA